MTDNKDRRVSRTKKAIHSALLELLQQKTISEISVQELTERADVNRKTFYNHYNDLYAALDELEDQCVEHLISLLKSREFNTYVDDPSEFFRLLITELSDNEEYYILFVQAQKHSRISQKLIRREKELLLQLIDPARVNEIWLDYFLNFISAGVTTVIHSWFASGKEIPVESLAEFFSTLFTAQDARRFVSAMQNEPAPADRMEMLI